MKIKVWLGIALASLCVCGVVLLSGGQAKSLVQQDPYDPLVIQPQLALQDPYDPLTIQPQLAQGNSSNNQQAQG